MTRSRGKVKRKAKAPARSGIAGMFARIDGISAWIPKDAQPQQIHDAYLGLLRSLYSHAVLSSVSYTDMPPGTTRSDCVRVEVSWRSE